MSVSLDARPSNPSDQDLIVRVRASDGEAVALLYRRYGTPLLRLAMRLTGSLQDAEEVVQDVFVGLPLALRRYEENGRFGAWLRRVTARVAITRLERTSRRREVELREAESLAVEPVHEGIADRMAIEAAVAALPDALRAVFVLRFIEKFTHEEIAETLGIRRGTSEVRLHRAIRLLRQHLGDDR